MHSQVKCKNSAKQGWGKKKRDASADVLPTAIATTTSSQVYSNVVQVRDYDKFLAGESDEVANELQTADGTKSQKRKTYTFLKSHLLYFDPRYIIE